MWSLPIKSGDMATVVFQYELKQTVWNCAKIRRKIILNWFQKSITEASDNYNMSPFTSSRSTKIKYLVLIKICVELIVGGWNFDKECKWLKNYRHF